MRTYRPGPRGRATPVTWRQWLLPLGATAGVLALLALTQGGPPDPPLTYSQFLGEVGSGAVRAVTIGPAGQVTGTLATGQPFTTAIRRYVILPGAGYSEQTQWLIDRAVAALLTKAEACARELLTRHMEALHRLTAALVDHETVNGDQVRELVQAAGSDPWIR
jgi:cell division protease FtsH